MDNFSAVRALAAEKWAALSPKAPDALAVIAAMTERERYIVVPLPPDHPTLGGADGVLSRATSKIYVSSALDPRVQSFVTAHEYGHVCIETPDDPVVARKGLDPGSPEEPTPLGVRRVEAYSPQERREQLANVFAREFLLPRSLARRLFIDDGMSGEAIAKDLRLPPGLVYQQLAASLLLPAPSSAEVTPSPPPPPLDPSQETSAKHADRALLVEAGPGTGKTRTLVARVEHLLARGVHPSSILVLTFSNKAAGEIRERIARSAPAAAMELWAGTFHSFGLELLRKYGDLVDVAQPVKLLDQADQLALLEDDLLQLGLEHYLRLQDPLADLRHVLVAISRGKDDLKTPGDYAKAAVAWRATAADDEEITRADKAIEVARVYRHYDLRMRRDKTVDFGDLIARVVELFDGHPEILADIKARYSHVLVDEYQDVNRASAVLVKRLAGDGRNLWLVGDAKQSIYRFRGAAPVNTRDFESDFPGGKRASLKVNYRSVEQIVKAFDAFARTMNSVRAPAELTSARGPGAGPIEFNVATDLDAEIEGIARQIRKFEREGIALAEQAVLCKSNALLEDVSIGLEALGIPVLYLGDLFERPEVSDFLALLSFVSEPWRGGLHRVAEMEPYRAPLADVRSFLDQAEAADIKPLEMLRRLGEVSGLSDAGREAFGKLAADLSGIGYATGPGSFLSRLLFDRGLVRPYLADEEPAGQQRRLAIHQLIQFAIERDRGDPRADPKRQLLDWIRRLEAFGDERSLREPPAAISRINAVRLMTIHGSKGLEFRAVHLPSVAQRRFPKQWSGQRCAPPPGFYPTSPKEDQSDEEECLFFVALSRAKDKLSISRARKYSKKAASNPSEFLGRIRGSLPLAPDAAPTWTGALPPEHGGAARVDLAEKLAQYDARDLDQYARCPRQYLYQRVLGLGGGRSDNPYVSFHRAVYRVLRWLGGQAALVGPEAVEAELTSAWKAVGPVDHTLEPLYRDAADRMIALATKRRTPGTTYDAEARVDVDGVRIKVTLDEMEGSGPGGIARRLRTGRKPKESDKGILHPLMHLAVLRSYPDGRRFEVHYLTGNESEPIAPSKKVLDNRLDTVREILSGLALGEFPAEPSEVDDCPRCPHYFICPSIST